MLVVERKKKKVQDVMKQPFCLNVYGCSGASKVMNGYFGGFAGDIFDQFVQLCKKTHGDLKK